MTTLTLYDIRGANPLKLQVFQTVYLEELKRAITERPEVYAYPVEEAEEVAFRMMTAICKGSANKDSIAIQRTLKRLGIKNTYKAIAQYLEQGSK